MARKGTLGATLAVVVFLISSSGPVGASSSPATSLEKQTVTIDLPGPFSGCSALSPTDNTSTLAVLDLILPSAFQTNSQGNLIGEGGPIASAELTSLQPETVQYTISPNMYWSDGVAFTADDLVNWWMQERSVNSVASVGYRDISSFDVSNGGLTVTARFSKPYADWNSLFRDVEAEGSIGGCKISSFKTRPSLGPYEVQAASSNEIVLVENPKWPLDQSRFGKVVFVTSPVPLLSKKYFANLFQPATPQTVGAVVKYSTIQSRITESNSIEDLQFSKQVGTLLVREALSLSINRQKMIDNIWGQVTYTPAPAASVLYAQGANNYPGPSGTSPSEQTTTTTSQVTTTTISAADCVVCATKLLNQAGYSLSDGHWRQISTGRDLSVSLAVGPTSTDRRVAQEVIAQWRSFGVNVNSSNLSTELDVNNEVVANKYSVGIFARPTTTSVSYAASSWCGPNYEDSFTVPFRSLATNGLCTNAESVFNPVSAEATWATLDIDLQSTYWVRPLVTAPVLNDWSPLIAQISSSYQMLGITDQIPTWSEAVPSTSTTQ
jgi:peptide/nickel transport system substrate-binding protein